MAQHPDSSKFMHLGMSLNDVIARSTEFPAKIMGLGNVGNLKVGAEGDFSTIEIDKALELKFKPVSLGNNRLRTETAAIVACHILNLVNEIND